MKKSVRAIEKWWGKTYDGKFHVSTAKDVLANMAQKYVAVGQFGRLHFDSDLVNGRSESVISQIVSVYAPNENRFLEKGLTVYAQERFGVNKPINLGLDLHVAAKRMISLYSISLGQLEALNFRIRKLVKGKRWGSSNAMIVVGSFVRYLIERFGMEKFRALYALTPMRPGENSGGGTPERWKQVYGLTLDELEDEWQRHIKSEPRPVQRAPASATVR